MPDPSLVLLPAARSRGAVPIIPVTQAAPLEPEVEDALAHPLPAVRASVVPLLGTLAAARHQGPGRTASCSPTA